MKKSLSQGYLAYAISICVVICFAITSRAAEVRITGKVYDAESSEKPSEKNLLFNYRSEVEKKADGVELITSTFTDPEGHVTGVETIERKNGTLIQYRVEQKQLETVGTITIENGKATFKYTRDGQTKSNTEDFGPDFLVGPGVVEDMKANWSQIQSGKRLSRRIGVSDRAESIGFEYFKDGEEDRNGKHVVVVKMKASNFLISAIVNPLRFYFSPDGQELTEFRGRSLMKLKDGDSWKDLEATNIYDNHPGGNSK